MASKIEATWRKLHPQPTQVKIKPSSPFVTPTTRPARPVVQAPLTAKPTLKPKPTYTVFSINSGTEIKEVSIPDSIKDIFTNDVLVPEGNDIATVENVTHVAMLLFANYIDTATAMSESCGGGGGSSPESGWGKKDDWKFAHRCVQIANSMCKSKPRHRGFHRQTTIAMIKRSKNREEKPDFDDIVNNIEQEVETQQVEQDLANRLMELKQLSSAIDKATAAVINAKLTLESAIRQSQREEGKLGEAVIGICNKVDSINQHIDNVLYDAPTKLKISVYATDEDMKKIDGLFAKHRQWVLDENLKQLRDINDKLAVERKKTMERYKEYDGCYLGHYAQWLFWFFFIIGVVITTLVIYMILDSHYHWSR